MRAIASKAVAGSAPARHKRQRQRVKWCDVDYVGDDDAPFKQAAAARGVPVG